GFAQQLISHENLGRNGAADYLSISFSATDYVGHTFGPNSVEAEDNLIRLDATLARLFAFIDKTVGLQNTVIVLSADHGVDDIPESLHADGYAAERLGGDPFKAKLNAALRQRLNVNEDLVASSLPPNLYLDPAQLHKLGLDTVTVENVLADVVRAEPGVAYVFTHAELMAGHLGNKPLLDKIQRAFHPQRSGDVIAIPQQFDYFDEAPDYYATTHGTPYSYDTFVPVIVLAPGVKAMTVREPVAPGQIAPTLSALLGTKPPSGCVCEPPLPHILSP
ncbi:MAG TPA: alkaline phosphatase family protein, partial [Candidatus Acidoferrum sp.]|nr:alkaline phosphatase family protein [Candidatus Acidoferrum sp.]